MPGWRSASRPDYGGMVARGETPTIQIVADGTDSNSTNVALGYARVLLAGYSEELIADRIGGQRAGAAGQRGHPRVVQSRISKAATS